MHKTLVLIATVLSFAIISPVMAEETTDSIGTENLTMELSGIAVHLMTATEMEETVGALFARGTRRSRRLKRYSWRNRVSRPERVHCDIIARNRAETMGFDTSSANGNYRDYNHVTVRQIFNGQRSNGYTAPPPGTAGYIFTGGADGKTHLQFYDNRAGGPVYTRYSNGSYAGTETINNVAPGYRPDSVSQQSFVPLPRRDYRTVVSW